MNLMQTQFFKGHYSLTNTRGFPLNCMSGVTPSIYPAARCPFSGVQVLGSQVSQSPSPCSYLVVAGTLGKKIVSFSTLYFIQENQRRLLYQNAIWMSQNVEKAKIDPMLPIRICGTSQQINQLACPCGWVVVEKFAILHDILCYTFKPLEQASHLNTATVIDIDYYKIHSCPNTESRSHLINLC